MSVFARLLSSIPERLIISLKIKLFARSRPKTSIFISFLILSWSITNSRLVASLKTEVATAVFVHNSHEAIENL